MAKHLTVGTIIEKNKISSDTPFLILVDAIIRDENNDIVQTIRFAKNSENVVFNGETYQAANFDIDISVENNSEPSIKMTAQDQTRTLSQYIEAYGGCVGSEIVMTVVNAGALDAPPEIQETFKITSSAVNEYVVEFNLGTDSTVNRRFPLHRQFKDRCSWKYKGNRCGYSGGLATCDYTFLGENGCVAHNNAANFGAFPGLNSN